MSGTAAAANSMSSYRARGRFASLHGPVTTDRKTEKSRFHLAVGLPVNTTAEVWIPSARAEDVTRPGARFPRRDDGCAVFVIGSGQYRFTA